jgi:hypothetical protein
MAATYKIGDTDTLFDIQHKEDDKSIILRLKQLGHVPNDVRGLALFDGEGDDLELARCMNMEEDGFSLILHYQKGIALRGFEMQIRDLSYIGIAKIKV